MVATAIPPIGKNYSQFPDGNITLNSKAKLPIFQDGQTRHVLGSNIIHGSSITPVFEPNDISPIINGFRQINQEKSYVFMNPMTFTEPILLPAGYIGRIDMPFLEKDGIFFDTDITDINIINSLFQTLFINADIFSIEESQDGNTKSQINTLNSHKLNEGQYVNIVETGTIYDQKRLLISNVKDSSFDVDISYTSGITLSSNSRFDTGLYQLQLCNINTTSKIGNENKNYFAYLQSTPDPTSLLSIQNCKTKEFTSAIHANDFNNIFLETNDFDSIENDIIFHQCKDVSMSNNIIRKLKSSDKSIGVKISQFNRFFSNNSNFILGNASQIPFSLHDIDKAESVIIQNSPDNGMADNYFDPDGANDTDLSGKIFTSNNRATSSSVIPKICIKIKTTKKLRLKASYNDDFTLRDTTNPSDDDWIIEDLSNNTSTINSLGQIRYTGIDALVKIGFKTTLELIEPKNQTGNIMLCIDGIVVNKTKVRYNLKHAVYLGDNGQGVTQYLSTTVEYNGFLELKTDQLLQLYKKDESTIDPVDLSAELWLNEI